MTGAPSTGAAATAAPFAVALAPVILVLLAVDALITLVLEVLYLPSYLGSVAFPITALLAGVINTGLVYAAGTVSERASLRYLPLVVWTLGFLACSTRGPGGDVLLGSDWRTLLLLIGGLAPPLAFIALRDSRPARRTAPA